MANAHKHKLRGIRGIDDETWDAFDEAAKAASTDRSSAVRAFVEWFLARDGASLPERPLAGAWSAPPEA
ncbi:hypothetical protein ACH4F6_27045 [Streptomyces sp. NPDC017936]|uniref:hypothetical protein n=1 Tax=Streptomyces sp. NPDC017936 TaxID=3365016 RepID=UPI0037A0BCAC